MLLGSLKNRISLNVALATLTLFAAAPALAVPVTYGLTTGTITVEARRTSDFELVFNETLDLSTDSFVTWDSAGVPAVGAGGTLDDFQFSIDPGQGPFATLLTYGPFDMVTVETAMITPDFGAGYQTNLVFPSGSVLLIDAGQIDIDATYSAENSTTGATTPGPVSADIAGVSNLSGQVEFLAGVIQVALDSIVMGTLDGTPFGEAGNDLDITANINFFGDSNVVPTPEPGTALLLGLGLAALSARRERR